MSLDMLGHIDGDFVSVGATRHAKSGGYVNGVWVETAIGNGYVSGYVADGYVSGGTSGSVDTPHVVNIQPLTDKEINNLGIGLERISDTRKMYVNDGDLFDIAPENTWSFDGINGVFKCVALDNRPWRNYCKIIVNRQDDE